MKTFFEKYGRVLVPLVMIFLCGQALGWALGRRIAETAAKPVIAKPQEWAGQGMERLSADLGLTDAQVREIAPIMQDTADRIYKERRRALFQIHLQTVDVHDRIAQHLSPEQKVKLARSREKLLNYTEAEFSDLLQEVKKAAPPAASIP